MQPGAFQILGGEGIVGTPVIRCTPGMRGYQSVPDKASGVSASTSASANTYGTEVQITAGLPYDAYLVAVLVGCDGSATDAYVQLGITAGAAAALIAELKVMSIRQASGIGILTEVPLGLMYPIFVPAGTRLGAKVARSVAASVAYLVSYIVVPTDEVFSLARARRAGMMSGAEAYHDHNRLPSIRNFGTGRGNSMVPGASLAAGAACTAGTSSAYGAYAAVIAAGPKADYIVTHLLFGLPSAAGLNFVQVGLAIGAAGKEFPIADIAFMRLPAITAADSSSWPAFMLPIGLLIPRGARLSARIATSTDSATGNVDVTGCYARDLVQELATS